MCGRFRLSPCEDDEGSGSGMVLWKKRKDIHHCKDPDPDVLMVF